MPSIKGRNIAENNKAAGKKGLGDKSMFGSLGTSGIQKPSKAG